MDSGELIHRLDAIKSDPNFRSASAAEAAEWTEAGAGAEYVEPILRFMEANPDLDYGMPGGLVHFLESLHGRGYEQLLLDSIQRQPTKMTTWMLNRLINGTDHARSHVLYVAAFRAALGHPLAGEATIDQVRRFLALYPGSRK